MGTTYLNHYVIKKKTKAAAEAIGNSVSCGVAEALTLAWYSQNEDISSFFEAQPL